MRLYLWLGLWAVLSLARNAQAEVDTVVSGYQYGLTYLPLMVMQEQHLVEKQAQAMQIKDLKTDWKIFSGPAPINDGLLSGSLHFGGVGTPSLVTLWAKTRSSIGIRAVGSLAYMPMYLNTNNDKVKTLEDFGSQDKIAVPSVKVGVQAVTLQMAAAQKFGLKQFDKLDYLTVGMAHPEAFVALLSGKSGISAHFASVPFQSQEIEQGKGKVHTVLKSYDILGGPATFTLVVAAEKFRKANPKVYEAYTRAFEEATKFINGNKKEAADLYLKVSGSKETPASILALLNDPENVFDLTPKQISKYATFMHEVGTIKEQAASWQDLAHPNLAGRPGS